MNRLHRPAVHQLRRTIRRSPLRQDPCRPLATRCLSFTLLCLLAIGLGPAKAHAASGTWSSSAALPGLWQTPGNWVSSIIPGSASSTTNTDTATFNSFSSFVQVNPDLNRNLENVTFDTSAVAYTVGTPTGNPLLLTAGGTIQIAATFSGTMTTESVNGPLALEGSYTFANNSAAPSIFFNTLSFGGAITSGIGPGEVLTVTCNNPVVILAAAIGGGTGTITLLKNGTGMLTLNGNNTFTGSVTIAAGILSLGSSNALNANNAIVFNSANSTTLTLNGNSVSTGLISGTFAANTIQNASATPATLTITSNVNGNSAFFAGIIQDGAGGGALSLAVNLAAASEELLGGNNTFTGGVTINSGLLLVNNAGALNSATPNAVAFGPGSTGALFLGGISITVNGLSSNANLGSPVVENGFVMGLPATLTINNAGGNSYSGVVEDGPNNSGSGALSLVKTGAGTQTLGGILTFSGGITVNQGTLALTGSSFFIGGVVINGGNLLIGTPGALNFSAPNSVTFGAGSTGTMTLAGNSVTISGLNTNANVGTPVVQNQSSTPAFLTINVAVSSTFAGTLEDGAGSGALALVKLGSGTFTLSGTNVFTGPLTIVAGTVVESAGALANNVTNQATFVYNGGSFGGRLTNAGIATFNADFTAGNGLENDSSLTFSSGRTITLNGAGLDNEGTLTVSGATLYLNGSSNVNRGNFNLAATLSLNGVTLTNAGSMVLNGGLINGAMGTLTNAAGGTLSGTGTIQNGFSNNGGLVTIAGGTINITPAFANSGIIQLTSITADLVGGAIANSNMIQGFGNVGNAITNSGTVQALGGSLFLGGTLSNPAAGLLTSGTGTELYVTAGLTTNAGIINLTGGVFDNGGHALNNTGQISGYGIFRTGGTGLDNNGSVTLSGGVTTVDGNVTNENGRTVTIAYTPAIFTGLVTNNGTGTFKTLSTTATFAGGSGGTFTNAASANMIADGTGVLDIDGAPTLMNNSVLTVNGGTLRLKYDSLATIGTGVTATVASGATLELAGAVSQLNQTVNIANSSQAVSGGLLVSSSANQNVGTVTGIGNAIVNSGGSLTAYQIRQNALSILGTGKVILIPSGTGSATNPTGPNNINFSSNIDAISIGGTMNNWTGTLDIGNNGLVIQYGGGTDPYATTVNMIKSGYANGQWTGTGITSSLARAAVLLGSPTPALNIGLIDFVPNTAGFGSSIAFEGQTITTSAVQVRLTYMDEQVQAGDMAQANATSDALFFAANYGSGTNWHVGDITHDGVIDTNDALLFAANYVVGLPSLDGTTGNAAALASRGNFAAVPEPASLLLGAIGAFGLGMLIQRR